MSTAPAGPSRILVPVDFSDASRRAFLYAQLLAQHFGASVVALHAWRVPQPMEGRMVLTPSGEEEPYATWVESLVAKQFEAFLESNENVERVTRRGHPVEIIVEEAETQKADLIVMGTRGAGDVSRARIGSVAEKTVRLAPCPVLTVRGSANAAG